MKKKMLATMLLIAILCNMMVPTAYAVSGHTVEIDIPSQRYCDSFNAYTNQTEAQKNYITVRVKESEFPVRATIKTKNGVTKEYEFDTYGTKDLKQEDHHSEMHAFAIICTLGFAAIIPKDTVYARIWITTPEETTQQEKETEVKDPSEVNPESKQEEIDLDKKLQPLFDKMNFQLGKSSFEAEVKDFLLGKWDGTLKSDTVAYISSNRSVFQRTYRWNGFDQLNGKRYPDIEVNLDYVGPLEVKGGEKYSLALDYVSNRVEQWQSLDKKDSWSLAFENERLDSVVLYNIDGEGPIGGAFTLDEENQKHLYLLMPNQEVLKIS